MIWSDTAKTRNLLHFHSPRFWGWNPLFLFPHYPSSCHLQGWDYRYLFCHHSISKVSKVVKYPKIFGAGPHPPKP